MNRSRFLFLVFSSFVATAALWFIWKYLGTHPPCCDSIWYAQRSLFYREFGLWKAVSEVRTYGYPFYLSLFAGELSRETWAGTRSGSLFVWNTVFFISSSWFFVLSATKINRRFFYSLSAGVLLNPFVLVYVPHVLTESLSIIVALLAAGFFFRIVKRGGRYGSVFFCAAMAGYLIEIRIANLGISLALLMSMLVVFFFHHCRDAMPKGQGRLSVVVLLVGLALPLAVQMSMNWVAHGELTAFPVRAAQHAVWRYGIEWMSYETVLQRNWKAVPYLSPWFSDLPVYEYSPLSFYLHHPWIGVKTWFVHLYSSVNYDFFWIYLHAPKYSKYSWHQLLSSAIQYLGLLGAATLVTKRRLGPLFRSDLMILLAVLVVVLSAGIIALSHGETRFGYSLIAISSFSALAWVQECPQRSWVVNGASFAGLAVYLYLSAELSIWLVSHATQRLL